MDVAMAEDIPLSTIAHGRSGDKGNQADVVARYFAPLGPSRVERFEAANLLAVNFMLYDVLAGGASQSLRIDTQGKTLALTLLQLPMQRPANLDAMQRS